MRFVFRYLKPGFPLPFSPFWNIWNPAFIIQSSMALLRGSSHFSRNVGPRIQSVVPSGAVLAVPPKERDMTPQASTLSAMDLPRRHVGAWDGRFGWNWWFWMVLGIVITIFLWFLALWCFFCFPAVIVIIVTVLLLWLLVCLLFLWLFSVFVVAMMFVIAMVLLNKLSLLSFLLLLSLLSVGPAKLCWTLIPSDSRGPAPWKGEAPWWPTFLCDLWGYMNQ